MKEKKVTVKTLLKSSEFTRADAVGITIKKYGREKGEKFISEKADKLFTEKTGKPSNIPETTANVKYGFRLLRGFLGVPKSESPKVKSESPKEESESPKA